MKKLVIILVIVGVSFLALLVYGIGRGEPAGGPTKDDCGNPPQGDDLDEDDFEDWCPPSLAEATRPLQVRFAKGLGIEKRKVAIGALGAAFPVKADLDARMRAARLQLIDGKAAVATGPKSRQCLCRPGTIIPDELRDKDKCGRLWTEDRRELGWKCQEGDDRGVIPFDKLGGTLRFEPLQSAVVTVE